MERERERDCAVVDSTYTFCIRGLWRFRLHKNLLSKEHDGRLRWFVITIHSIGCFTVYMCMCVCVCVCASMYLCVRACVRILIHLCVYLCLHTPLFSVYAVTMQTTGKRGEERLGMSSFFLKSNECFKLWVKSWT